MCKTGGHVVRTHDNVKRTLYRRIRADLGFDVLEEQRVPSLDKVGPNNTIIAARLDLGVVAEGRIWWCDVSVVDPLSVDRSLQRSRAQQDGHAAGQAEDEKRRRYDASVVPLIWEVGGRPGTAGVAFLRRLYAGAPSGLFSAMLQEVGCVIASSVATCAMAARGPR